MQSKESRTITIVGAGIAGCFLALILAKRGYLVTLFESNSEKELFDKSSKKSFNVTFYHYGAKVLKKMGLWSDLLPNLILLKGSLTYVPYASRPLHGTFAKEIPYFTIQRSQLLAVLLKHVSREKNITLIFQHKLISVNKKNKILCLRDKQNSIITHHYAVLIGSDGVHSQVREALQRGQKTNHKKFVADWSYKQLIISKELAKNLKMDPKIMYAWTGKKAILTAFPRKDGAFVGMLILPRDKKNGFSHFTSRDEVREFIHTYFPFFSYGASKISDAIFINPEGLFFTVDTSPWFYKDSIGIVGDAAHGFLPFSGQGISTAFADCLALDALLTRYHQNWGQVLPKFQENRKKHTDTLSLLSSQSFLRFQRDKKFDFEAAYDTCEAYLGKLLPSFFLPPLFTLITVAPERAYDYALQKKRQRRLLTIIGVPLFLRGILSLMAAFTFSSAKISLKP